MSIQRTAESALHALQELYNAIDLSSQQQSSMSINDSENLVQALCNLSQLINHINQTGMCGHTSIMNTHLDSKRFDRKRVNKFIAPHLTNYDENIMMDSTTIGSSLQSGQSYGECVLYHPIRITTTCADGPTVLHENDFVRNERQYRKDHDHNKRFPHHNHIKKNHKRMLRSYDRHSTNISRASRSSRSGSRRSRMSHRSQRSTHGRASQSRDRSSRSSRRSSRYSQSSRSKHRRSQSHGRRNRSSQRRSRQSRSSQRRSRSRRRSSHKRRSADLQNRRHYHHQIPSHPVLNVTNPTASSYPSNQIGSTSMGIQPSTQQPYIRSLPSPAPITTTSNDRILPAPTFTPTMPLPPPPTISSLHHPHSSSQMPMQQQQHQLPSIIHDNNTPLHRRINNPFSDQSSSYQQVPVSTTSTGNTALLSQQQQQPSSLLSSTNPMLNISTQNDVLSSSISPLQTTNSAFTSRSDNCPECRAITRLLQWAPLKCYDAAGIRRGVFLAGPKSEQLLKALYSSIKDSSLSLDDIENCLCDDE
ncbi:unnamed protein product [Rotaria sordida]|uniref:Uncharacterized protein n=1 Tax=Rotaria sordida TaxID=392033 RepID=A0A814ERW7_9BILA|nr:unnamed protein product [Rotaria sordida]CAF1037551.1 unnamed protein product [Rotaria sordida]